MKNFEKLNPGWRNDEIRIHFDDEYPNFKRYLDAHFKPKSCGRLEELFRRYDMWQAFQENKRRSVVGANRFFDKFFFEAPTPSGRYASDPDAVLVRHIVIELIDEGIFTIDTQGIIFHEKVELLALVNRFGVSDSAFKDMLTALRRDRTEYLRVHGQAACAEYALYQWLGAMILRKRIPPRAFFCMHPVLEARKEENARALVQEFDADIQHLAEPVSRDNLTAAAELFEKGGYRYCDKEALINRALDAKQKDLPRIVPK